MQKNATSSVRRPATLSHHSNQLDSFAGPNNAETDGHAYTFPTFKQQAAISELQAFDEEHILAWITVVRSIEPGFQHRACHGSLSSQQLEALSILKDCHDSDIIAWLEYHHRADSVNKQRVKPSSASPSHRDRRLSTKSALKSSISSVVPPSVLSSSSSYSTPRSSLGYGSPLPQLLEGNTESEDTNHAHWCTYEEHLKPVYTCEGWKRHEKEHERGFLCMPDGPVVYARHGRRCALCDSLDPSPEHLAGHNISLCTGSSKGPLKKSRKGDMMKHLAQHGIAGPASAVLAGKWRFELNKKAYSCGFCIKLFSTITDRSNHIDNEHWRSGQNMSAWDLSTTIRGLLLQPEVEAAWQDILRSNPHLVESSLRWKLPLADGLQLRLEMGVVGEETGTVLARAAQELSSPDFGTPNQENVTSMTRPRPMVPESFSRATLRPGSFPWTDMNTSNVGLWTTQRSTAQNPSASLTNSHESLYPWNQSEHLSGSFLDLGDGEIDWSRFTS